MFHLCLSIFDLFFDRFVGVFFGCIWNAIPLLCGGASVGPPQLCNCFVAFQQQLFHVLHPFQQLFIFGPQLHYNSIGRQHVATVARHRRCRVSQT